MSAQKKKDETQEAGLYLGRIHPIKVLTLFSSRNKQLASFNKSTTTTNFHHLDVNKDILQQWNEFMSYNEYPPDLFLSKLSKSFLLKRATQRYTVSDVENNPAILPQNGNHLEYTDANIEDLQEHATLNGNGLLVADHQTEAEKANFEKLLTVEKETLDRIQIVPLSTQTILADRIRMQGIIRKVCSALNTVAELDTTIGAVNGSDGSGLNPDDTDVYVSPYNGQMLHSAFDIDGEMLDAVYDNPDLYSNGTSDMDNQFKHEHSSEDLPKNGVCETSTTYNGDGVHVRGGSMYQQKTVVKCHGNMIIDPHDLKNINLAFPIIVKSTSSGEKTMALVPNIECLLHFQNKRTSEIPGIRLVAEEYIPHNDTVLKVGLIGKHIYVVRRASIPDVTDFRRENLVRISQDINGQFVEVKNTGSKAMGSGNKIDGYLQFDSSTTKRRECFSSQALEDCDDLDIETIKRIVHTVSRSLRLKLLGVDILISSIDRSMYIIDINAFPGFSDIEGKDAAIMVYLEEEARKRAFVLDSQKLSCDDLLQLCLEHNQAWMEADISAEDMHLKTIRKNRIYEVRLKFDDFCGNDGSTLEMNSGKVVNSAALLKFRNFRTPGRMISDKLNFDMNISEQLNKQGLGLGGMTVISATYFGKTIKVGYVRDWVHGNPLKNYLQQHKGEASLDKLRNIFGAIGMNIAKFHQLLKNPDFHKDLVQHHFPGDLATQPVADVRFNVWQREALALLSMSDMSTSDTWKHFYNKITSQPLQRNDICRNIIKYSKSTEATALVFGHFDCNVSNIIVSEVQNEEEVQTCLIDEEWACPNMAAYDFGKLISSVVIMMRRNETILKMKELEDLVEQLVMSYLKTMKSLTKNEEVEKSNNVGTECEDELEDVQQETFLRFLKDVWSFTAYAALLNSYSNLIHASKDGQLSNVEDDLQLTLSSSGDFNWIRHAYDHYLIFEEFSDQSLEK